MNPVARICHFVVACFINLKVVARYSVQLRVRFYSVGSPNHPNVSCQATTSPSSTTWTLCRPKKMRSSTRRACSRGTVSPPCSKSTSSSRRRARRASSGPWSTTETTSPCEWQEEPEEAFRDYIPTLISLICGTHRYVEAKKDRVTVVFSTVFKDDDDVIIGKVFMQVRGGGAIPVGLGQPDWAPVHCTHSCRRRSSRRAGELATRPPRCCSATGSPRWN